MTRAFPYAIPKEQQHELRLGAREEQERRQRERAARAKKASTDLLTWTKINRKFISPNVEFDIDNHLYLKGIYLETAGQICVMKAGQVGISEWAVSRALYTCDELNGNVFYVMPTGDDISDFSQMRFNTALEASDYLDGIIVDASTKGKRGTDRVTMKRVRDNFIVFRGGRVDKDGKARQLKSVPADLVIRDEVDEMDTRVKEIASKRLGHSNLKHHIGISTPSYPGFGIAAEWELSDQREWHVPCPACGLKQTITIDNIVLEWDDAKRPVVWNGQKAGEPYAACVKCSGELDRLVMGEWVPTYPGRDVVGFRPTKLFSAQNTLTAVLKNLDTTDETKKKEAFNQDLGLPYSPVGGRLDGGDLDLCKRDYGPLLYQDIPETTNVFMGVDIGKVVNVIIRADKDKETGERPLLFAGEVGWSDLPLLMDKYRVRICVVDALPETTKARELQGLRARGVVWVAYYIETDKGMKTAGDVRWNYKEWQVDLDRTRVMDSARARIYTQANTLPDNARQIPNYYAQMTAPIRIIREDSRGVKVSAYINSEPDHYYHAETLCYVASEFPMGWGA